MTNSPTALVHAALDRAIVAAAEGIGLSEERVRRVAGRILEPRLGGPSSCPEPAASDPEYVPQLLKVGRHAAALAADPLSNHAVSSEWHPSRNGRLRPADLPAGSRKPVWWRCSQGHKWVTSPYERARRGSGCRMCRQEWGAASHQIAAIRQLLDEVVDEMVACTGLGRVRAHDLLRTALAGPPQVGPPLRTYAVLTAKEKRVIVVRAKERVPLVTIAKNLDATVSAVQRVAREAGVRTWPVSPARGRQVLERARRGEPAELIAADPGLAASTVRRVLEVSST